MINGPMNNAAREAILGSIRSHLAASAASDRHVHSVHPDNPVVKSDFKKSIESVDGHCIVTTDVTDVLSRILADLKPRRIVVSDSPQLQKLLNAMKLVIDEIEVAPDARDIFRFDVGITTAQAAVAETGTLVLDSTCERHRLVSLVPPVHIAIINASSIRETLSDALALLRKNKEISPAVTFITGPSRTADIELTLTIGVHGPQELYVIVDESN